MLRDIKVCLKAAKISAAYNLYAEEPTTGYHFVYVHNRKGDEAIAALRAGGLHAAWVPACSNIYTDNIQVRRELRRPAAPKA